jgi:hypothetical protein
LSIDIELQHIVLRAQRQREKLGGRGRKQLELENQVLKFGQLGTVIRNHVFQVTLISFLLRDGIYLHEFLRPVDKISASIKNGLAAICAHVFSFFNFFKRFIISVLPLLSHIE